MATFYKYAEREADSFVNWGEIGKNLSDMLAEQQKIREDKRAAIDKASREFGETLSNAPQGEQKQLNQWALEYAANAQEARLLQDRLLKSGRLSVKDYTVMRQNINDGTKQAFTLVKEYQDEYKTKMERIKQDKSQDLEAWLMEQAEGFGNFTKSRLYINPTNFQVSVAGTKKQIVDGKEVYVMETDPNKFTTVNALRNRMKGTYDKYDLPNNVKAMVDNLGVEINSVERLGTLYQTGSISETLDITKRKNLPADAQGVIMKFEEAETKMLQAQLQNPYNTSSILTNTIGMAPNGKQYTYTFSEEERNKNPNLILLKDSETGNPTPVFTPEQEKAALDRLRLEARMQYDKKAEIKATPQAQLQERRAQTAGEMERSDLEAEAENFGRNLALFLTGDATQKDKAGRYFLGQQGITKLKPSATGFRVFEGGKFTDYPVSVGGKTVSTEDMGRSMVSLLNKSKLPEDVIIRAMKKYIGGKGVSAMELADISKGAIDYSAQFGEYANTNVPKLVTEDKPTDTAKKLTNTFGKLGFVFTPIEGTIGNGYTDKIKIKAPNGKLQEFVIDNTDNNINISNFISENRDDAKIEAAGLFKEETPAPTPAPGGGAPR